MRDKQIKEMAKALMDTINAKHGHTSMRGLAESLYNAGYRKASDVAREIFVKVMEAIEKGVAEGNKTVVDKTSVVTDVLIATGEAYAGYIGKSICEVFKKYESEGEGEG